MAEADPDGPFATIYPTRKDIPERLAHDVDTFGLHRRVVFGIEVTRFERVDSGLVKVFMHKSATCSDNGASVNSCPCCLACNKTEFSQVFQQVHIRTGACLTDSH